MADATIHVVCPNPALDRLQTVDRFTPYEVNRVTDVRTLAGGKGMIVCRTSRRLDAHVTAHGFIGGAAGRTIRDACVELGVVDEHIEVSGETRVTPVVIEASTGRSTVLNELGPQLRRSEQQAMLTRLGETVERGDVVVSTGSLPPGSDQELHAAIARCAVDRGALAIVDAHGSALSAVLDDLRARPVHGTVLIKPNSAELGQVLGVEDSAQGPLLHGLVEETGATFVVTLGAEGAVWVGETAFRVSSPQVDVVNATGSGDSFVAGLAAALGAGAEPIEAASLAAAMGAANAAKLTPDVDPDLVKRLRAEVEVTSLEAL